MELTIFLFVWSVIGLVTVFGYAVVFIPTRWPYAVTCIYNYGKTAEKPPSKTSHVISSIVQFVQVPKRWFTHFYIASTILNGGVAVLVWLVYVFDNPAPHWVISTVDFIMGSDRNVTVHQASVLVAVNLVVVQAFHRLYECLFISVFSNVKINFGLYLLGFVFYGSQAFGLLAEAPEFNADNADAAVISWSWIGFHHLLGAAIVSWAIWQQIRASWILADLRKDDRGKIVNMLHSVPYGGLFEYVSCPHYLAEIVFYVGLLIVLELRSVPFWVLFVFTLLNQTLSAVMSHRWYRKKYKDYPRDRRAIFPYIL